MRWFKFLLAIFSCVLTCAAALTPAARADETCNSPYLSNLIEGQEDYLYVWTLGVRGLGDGQDKLVTLE
jgi:selenium-binding protein 1